MQIEEKGIVLFDGECNLCDGAVQFIIKRDPNAYFQFASLQNNVGKDLLARFNVTNADTMYLIDGEGIYCKSTAVLRIVKKLKGLWKLLYVFILIPPKLRDRIYDVVAKNRYNWFGRNNQCMIPTSENKKRFLN